MRDFIDLSIVLHPWPWYVAGPLIGLMVPALLLVGNRSFGISGNLRHLCAALVPGRGAALTTPEEVADGLAGTRAFIADMWESVQAGTKAGKDLKTVYEETITKLKPKYGNWVIFDHCMPFDVTRCFDEATQFVDPRVWTAERDQQMWQTLEG